jgi:hypothetical protein
MTRAPHSANSETPRSVCRAVRAARLLAHDRVFAGRSRGAGGNFDAKAYNLGPEGTAL